jgi:proteasome lid subunit RPN8/RPN11
MEQAATVVLNRLLENDLLSACRRRLPYEMCGIIYGTMSDGRLSADGYDLVRNSSSSAVDTFSFHPGDWVSVYFHAQKNQRNIVGFFHTHPQGTALPSIKDEQGWIPWGTYWIISLTNSNSEIAVYRRGSQEKWVSLSIIREL